MQTNRCNYSLVDKDEVCIIKVYNVYFALFYRYLTKSYCVVCGSCVGCAH